MTRPGDTDRRTETGYRVLFDKETETDAWYIARQLKLLSQADRRMVRCLVDSCLMCDTIEKMEKEFQNVEPSNEEDADN